MFGVWCETAEDSGEGWDVAAQAMAPFVRAAAREAAPARTLPFSRAGGSLLHDAVAETAMPVRPAVNIVSPVTNMKRSRKHFRDVFCFHEEGGLF